MVLLSKSAICHFQENLFHFELVITSSNHGLHVLNRSGHKLTALFSEDYLQQARSSPRLQRLKYGMADSSAGNKSWQSEESWGEQRGSEVGLEVLGWGQKWVGAVGDLFKRGIVQSGLERIMMKKLW